MSYEISTQELHKWCSVQTNELESHSDIKVAFKMVPNSRNMGKLMAETLIEEIRTNNDKGEGTRAILPCGPKSWYAPFTEMVNSEKVSLKKLTVFHMDECLDWQGQLLPRKHPYNFRDFMEDFFYGGIDQELAVPEDQRMWITPFNILAIKAAIAEAPIDITLGGWGQDGHIAYNQTRRHPFSRITLDDLRNASTRVQENNLDTIITLGQRSFGAAYQFVPPMSVTLGVKECLSAKKVRVFSDTGTWKQTALRVALFSEPTVEYPLTLLQEHQDALIVATEETANHPISENPDWDFFGKSGYYPDN
ncbi:MAG: hypothetical protein COA79_08690 [Planctomycetota bacterium]|nr:MAG: hypothetical protein COA79_08690 [Planctomycetota bacterium]